MTKPVIHCSLVPQCFSSTIPWVIRFTPKSRQTLFKQRQSRPFHRFGLPRGGRTPSGRCLSKASGFRRARHRRKPCFKPSSASICIDVLDRSRCQTADHLPAGSAICIDFRKSSATAPSCASTTLWLRRWPLVLKRTEVTPSTHASPAPSY